MGIQELMEWLQRETRRCLDLRYSGGKWAVLLASGNRMDVVHGTVQDDPIRSLEVAKARWESRSATNPF